MLEIKLLDNKIDYDNLKPIGWDLVINDDREYDVYSIHEYYHTIGGGFGGNDYYCCLVDEKPTKYNLTPYNGHHGGVRWGIHVEDDHHYRNKWNDQSWEQSYTCYITRNGEIFYEIYGRGFSYLLAKAQVALTQIQEHSIPFHFRNWRSDVIGRTIFYRDEPGIITYYHMGGVIIEPDGINFFKRAAWDDDAEWSEESKDGIRVDILDEHIYWHRETWADKRIAKENQEKRDEMIDKQLKLF